MRDQARRPWPVFVAPIQDRPLRRAQMSAACALIARALFGIAILIGVLAILFWKHGGEDDKV